MKKKNKINEADEPTIMVQKSELKQTLSDLKGQKVKIVPVDGKIMETDGVIEPQDQATIKYLSNVKDEHGKTSKPFNIGDKQYQIF